MNVGNEIRRLEAEDLLDKSVFLNLCATKLF